MIKGFTATVLSALVFSTVLSGSTGGVDTNRFEVLVSESNEAAVSSVFAGTSADVILVDAGYDKDFCTGARCRVERGSLFVAEIIIATAERSQSVALITFLENNQTIQTGDTVKLKTI